MLSIVSAALIIVIIALSIVLVLTATTDNANTSIKIKYEAKQVNAHIEMEVWQYSAEAGRNIWISATNNAATFDEYTGTAGGSSSVTSAVDDIYLAYGDYVTYIFKLTNNSDKDAIHFNLHYFATNSNNLYNQTITLKYGATNALWNYSDGYSVVTHSAFGSGNPKYEYYNNNDVLVSSINNITANDFSYPAVDERISASIFGTIISGTKYQSSSYVEILPNSCFKVEVKFGIINYNSTNMVNYSGVINTSIYNSMLGYQQWSDETNI